MAGSFVVSHGDWSAEHWDGSQTHGGLAASKGCLAIYYIYTLMHVCMQAPGGGLRCIWKFHKLGATGALNSRM